MPKHKISRNNYFLLSALFIILGVFVFNIELPADLPVNYAYAHSLPVTENPAPDSIIPKGPALPSKLIIDFSERPSPTVSTIQVLNSKNEPVNNGDFKVIGDHDREAMTTLDTKKLTDGVYTVSWQTQSLDDGHIARGSYVFGIGNVGPGAAASIGSGKALQQRAPQIQAVTSDLDGIIKWPLIVSQAAIVGGIFSHLFLWENFGNKIKIKARSAARYDNNYDKTSLLWLRRFSIILIASSVAILAAGSSLLILQITELSIHNSIPADWKVFVSQLSGPSGVAWIMRSLTSLVVIASTVSYYYVTKGNMQKMAINSNTESRKRSDERISGREKIKIYLPLYIALVAGSISILANSVTSHNAGVQFLPSLSISLDWLHFMAVSIWVGGLFYLSSILVIAIRSRATAIITSATAATTTSTASTMRGNASTSNSERTRSMVLYYLALLLPRFSLLATISLGVIGVSGLYAAWIQLHSITALFTSPYGNILIIKLLAALPLVLLGGYHQLRLHRDMVLVAGIGRRVAGESGGNSRRDSSAGNSIQVSQTVKDKISDEDNNNNNNDSNDSPTNNNINPVNDKRKLKDVPSKFSKTIKVESLIAIGVLLAASLLTVTSPPAMNMNMPANGMSTPASTMSGMLGMSMQPAKNSTYNVQTKILGINTKIEINPFYAGFNVFKVSFTNADGKPNTKVYATELTFTNTVANIGPIVANLHKIRPGVFSITGAYVSQPGEWDIAMAAQRQSDLDLNYEFNAKVASAPTSPPAPQSSTQAVTGANVANNVAASGVQEAPPQFDSFAVLAIILAAAVVLLSTYYYRRSKKELRKTIEILEVEQ